MVYTNHTIKTSKIKSIIVMTLDRPNKIQTDRINTSQHYMQYAAITHTIKLDKTTALVCNYFLK